MSLSVPSIAFFGRAFSEYCAMFALRPEQIIGRSVLDVAAGPASFTADAFAAGIGM